MDAPCCFEFSVQSMVRGYHVYQEEWDATIGEILHCQREIVNCHDPYAVATLSDRTVVGHVPQKNIAYLFNIYSTGRFYNMVPSVIPLT